MATASNEQSVLLSLVRSNTENTLVSAFAGKKRISELSGKESLAIVDVVGLWMANLGVINSITDTEIGIIANFIRDNYNFLTIQEIKLAMNLSMTAKLNCDSELYNKSFSAKYVGKILNAYIEYRNSELSDFRNRVEVERQKMADVPPSPKEKMDIAIDFLKNCYKAFSEDNTDTDGFHIVYEFLKKTKRLRGGKEKVDAALKYGEKAAKEFMNTQYKDGMGNIVKGYNQVDKDHLKTRFAKSYIVADFFKNNKFEDFIASITIKEFE